MLNIMEEEYYSTGSYENIVFYHGKSNHLLSNYVQLDKCIISIEKIVFSAEHDLEQILQKSLSFMVIRSPLSIPRFDCSHVYHNESINVMPLKLLHLFENCKIVDEEIIINCQPQIFGLFYLMYPKYEQSLMLGINGIPFKIIYKKHETIMNEEHYASSFNILRIDRQLNGYHCGVFFVKSSNIINIIVNGDICQDIYDITPTLSYVSFTKQNYSEIQHNIYIESIDLDLFDNQDFPDFPEFYLCSSKNIVQDINYSFSNLNPLKQKPEEFEIHKINNTNITFSYYKTFHLMFTTEKL